MNIFIQLVNFRFLLFVFFFEKTSKSSPGGYFEKTDLLALADSLKDLIPLLPAKNKNPPRSSECCMYIRA